MNAEKRRVPGVQRRVAAVVPTSPGTWFWSRAPWEPPVEERSALLGRREQAASSFHPESLALWLIGWMGFAVIAGGDFTGLLLLGVPLTIAGWVWGWCATRRPAAAASDARAPEVKGGARRCTWCHDDLDPLRAAGCWTCGSAAHPACWLDAGGCRTPGCASSAARRRA